MATIAHPLEHNSTHHIPTAHTHSHLTHETHASQTTTTRHKHIWQTSLSHLGFPILSPQKSGKLTSKKNVFTSFASVGTPTKQSDSTRISGKEHRRDRETLVSKRTSWRHERASDTITEPVLGMRAVSEHLTTPHRTSLHITAPHLSHRASHPPPRFTSPHLRSESR